MGIPSVPQAKSVVPGDAGTQGASLDDEHAQGLALWNAFEDGYDDGLRAIRRGAVSAPAAKLDERHEKCDAGDWYSCGVVAAFEHVFWDQASRRMIMYTPVRIYSDAVTIAQASTEPSE